MKNSKYLIIVLIFLMHSANQAPAEVANRDVQKRIRSDMAVVVYANIDPATMIRLVITQEEIFGAEQSIRAFVDSVAAHVGEQQMTFPEIVEVYRKWLQNPTAIEQSETFGKQFYDFLFSGLQGLITGKTRLLIVPDGNLNFLPFETLLDPQGTYLVENYQISYVQSLNVWELLHNRFSAPYQKSLIAIGIERTNEIQALQKIVIDTETLIDDEATETKLKALFASGELTNYRFLHFAADAMIDVNNPEQSALILLPSASLLGKEREEEDGYLRLYEIAGLNFRAEVVTLSGDETGLGKLYKGEGVVGFIQAFMRAGADSVTVSLWPVADDPTTAFMTALYQLIAGQDMTYSEALNEVKRRFIAGDFGQQWQAPYYWAPFVYYGK